MTPFPITRKILLSVLCSVTFLMTAQAQVKKKIVTVPSKVKAAVSATKPVSATTTVPIDMTATVPVGTTMATPTVPAVPAVPTPPVMPAVPGMTTTTTTTTTVTTVTTTVTTVGSPADSAAIKLDQAVAAQAKGDKAAAADALRAGADAAEAQAKASKGDFKDKLLSQVGNLRSLLPLLSSGMLGGGALGKATSVVKMALGANQVSNVLNGGGSLLGSVSALTGGLNLLKGGAGSGSSSLIDGALSSVGQLKTGGAAAEPAARQALGGVMNLAKGLF